MVTENQIVQTAPRAWGVLASGEGVRATVRNNAITLPAASPDYAITGVGIFARLGADVELIGNTISRGDSGILITTGATARITDHNHLSGHRIGIAVDGPGASGTIEATTIDEGATIGIDIRATGTATSVGNTITAPRETGIQIRTQGHADVTGNVVTGPAAAVRSTLGPMGVAVRDHASGTVSENTISGFVNRVAEQPACGNIVDGDAREVVVDGNHFPPPPNESDVCDERVHGVPVSPSQTAAASAG
jgi:hypothetical protein